MAQSTTVIEIPVDGARYAVVPHKAGEETGQRTVGLMLHYASGRIWVNAARMHWDGAKWGPDDRQWEIGSLQIEPNPHDGDAWKTPK